VVHQDTLFTMNIDDINGRRVTYVSIAQEDFKAPNPSNHTTKRYAYSCL